MESRKEKYQIDASIKRLSENPIKSLSEQNPKMSNYHSVEAMMMNGSKKRKLFENNLFEKCSNQNGEKYSNEKKRKMSTRDEENLIRAR